MFSKSIDLKFWKIFNLAIRITGLCFIIGSSIFIFCVVIMFCASINQNNSDYFCIGIILAIILFVSGILLVKLKKYYPRHIIEYFEDNKKE